MDASILPFLPRLLQSESGALRWPSDLGFALKSVVSGPSVSHVLGPDSLCDFINDLRELSRLPSLSAAVSHGITTYFDDYITRTAAKDFFQTVLPFMADLAVRLPLLLTDHFNQSLNFSPTVKAVNLRVLRQQQPGLVYMTQELAAAILACTFFCLYPSQGRGEARLPYFNFDGLFRRVSTAAPQQEQKIHCILHYFERLQQGLPKGMISFERKVLLRHRQLDTFSPISEPNENFWSSSLASFCPMQVIEDGMIEDQCLSALEVDFANRFLGGGVLGQGCVQEEIRFVISPELIAGMLFMPAMQANEAIEIRGAERFSSYSGYGSSFCFVGDFIDTKPRDAHSRRETRIVAIDALINPGRNQYEVEQMLRETNKAFCGFLDHLETHVSDFSNQTTETRDFSTFRDAMDAVHTSSTSGILGIATGNWGCGAFGGDVELKTLLQWIAASQAGRPFLQYFTFGESHGQRLQQIADWIISEKWTVGELWGLLVDYGEKRLKGMHRKELFEWLVPHLYEPDVNEGSQQEGREGPKLKEYYN